MQLPTKNVSVFLSTEENILYDDEYNNITKAVASSLHAYICIYTTVDDFELIDER